MNDADLFHAEGLLHQRIPEPELMDSTEQVTAYAEADFNESDSRFAEAVYTAFSLPWTGIVADLGCGPGNICIRLATQAKDIQVVGLDAGKNMLLTAAKIAGNRFPNLSFYHAHLPDFPAEFKSACAMIVSNSLLHHLADPMALWNALNAMGTPGAAFFVGDLHRPESFQEARNLRDLYAADAPPVLQADFYRSLLAAYTIPEIEAQLKRAGINSYHIFRPTDRHVYLYGRLPL